MLNQTHQDMVWYGTPEDDDAYYQANLAGYGRVIDSNSLDYDNIQDNN